MLVNNIIDSELEFNFDDYEEINATEGMDDKEFDLNSDDAFMMGL
jgi:hypothetical protein